VKVVIDGGKTSEEAAAKPLRAPVKPLYRWKSYPANSRNSNRSKRWLRDAMDILEINRNLLPVVNEDEEAVGVITMEDVIEELLQVAY
jgi:metal transporter CNNM